MLGLIADLLDAGRIDTGTLSVSPEPTEVTLLVNRARTTFLSGGGRHTVTIDLPPELPRVMADRQRVEQVLKVRVTDLPDWRFARRDSSGPGMARHHQGASRHRTCAHRRAAHPRTRRTGPESPDYPDILLQETGRPAGCAGGKFQHVAPVAGTEIEITLGHGRAGSPVPPTIRGSARSHFPAPGVLRRSASVGASQTPYRPFPAPAKRAPPTASPALRPRSTSCQDGEWRKRISWWPSCSVRLDPDVRNTGVTGTGVVSPSTLSEDERRELIDYLADNPMAGDQMPGTGGVESCGSRLWAVAREAARG